jgi:hypothetical protein
VTVWTAEMHARLCELATADEVMSYAVIAEKLSIEFGEHLTKNACIGRAGRFGIRKQAAPSFITPGYARPDAKPKPERKTKMRVARFTVAPPNLVPRGPRRGRKTIMELTFRSCRWVYGEQPPYLFCGARTDGGSYCTEHQTVVYNGTFKRRA